VRMQMRTGGRLQPLDAPDHRDSTPR